MFGDALADCERWRRSYGDSHFNLAMLAYIYGRSGRQVEARQALDKLEQLNRHQHLDASVIAWAYLGMGDNEQTFSWLERGYREHSPILQYIKVHPFFDPLRGDPRFADLVRRVGLPET